MNTTNALEDEYIYRRRDREASLLLVRYVVPVHHKWKIWATKKKHQIQFFFSRFYSTGIQFFSMFLLYIFFIIICIFPIYPLQCFETLCMLLSSLYKMKETRTHTEFYREWEKKWLNPINEKLRFRYKLFCNVLSSSRLFIYCMIWIDWFASRIN